MAKKKAKKILIVEDDSSLLNALTDKFVREGFKVSQAKNGEKGLAMALKEHPDLILLDIVMPKMDGITVLKELRKDKWGKEVKVIILTNLGGAEKAAEALEAGTYDYLVKADWKIDSIIQKAKENLGV